MKDTLADPSVVGSGPRGWFTPAEFGAAMGRTRRWVDGRIARGEIRYTQVGRSKFIPIDEPDRLMEAGLRLPSRPPVTPRGPAPRVAPIA
jgi:hypothetical protein